MYIQMTIEVHVVISLDEANKVTPVHNISSQKISAVFFREYQANIFWKKTIGTYLVGSLMSVRDKLSS